MCSLVGTAGCTFSLVLSMLEDCRELPCLLVRAAKQGCSWEEVALRAHLQEGQKSLSLEEVRALPHTAARAGTDLSSTPWLCLRDFLSPTPCCCVRLEQEAHPDLLCLPLPCRTTRSSTWALPLCRTRSTGNL